MMAQTAARGFYDPPAAAAPISADRRAEIIADAAMDSRYIGPSKREHVRKIALEQIRAAMGQALDRGAMMPTTVVLAPMVAPLEESEHGKKSKSA